MVIEEVAIVGEKNTLFPPSVCEDVFIRATLKSNVRAEYRIPTQVSKDLGNSFPKTFVNEKPSLLAKSVEISVLFFRSRW
jgi:hypothetical protein